MDDPQPKPELTAEQIEQSIEAGKRGVEIGNESMRKAGRTTWSEEDWDAVYAWLRQKHST